MEAEPKDDDIRSADNHERLARLYHMISDNRNIDIKSFVRIIPKETDVNFIIPDCSLFKNLKPELVGSTLLHFAFAERNIDAFNYLLASGADYSMKNGQGSTVLHEFFENTFNNSDENETCRIDDRFIESILKAHLKDENLANPCNKHGISHFHGACAANNAQVVELFLKNGVPVDRAVNADSPVFPGYTPLHFATKFASLETARVLLRYDASLKSKNVAGTTALQIALQEKLKSIELRNAERDDEELMAKVQENERMMKLLLEIELSDGQITSDDSGLSTFHIVCSMEDTSLVESFLPKISNVDQCVETNSPLWPGYTALHFAALCNIETVKVLLNRGANIEAKNTEGISPFDICLERYGIMDISYVISRHPVWKDIKFLDCDVKLVDFVSALYHTSKLIFMARNFLISTQSYLPLDCPLWPGSTPLHLAVIFFYRDKARFHTKHEIEDDEHQDEAMKLFLSTKYFETIANILAQDAYGRTSIHLAYRMHKIGILNMLFYRNDKIENPIDIDNLSILHIAYLTERDHLIEELLFIGEDANIPILTDVKTHIWDSAVSAGSTPLHIATLIGYENLTKELLTSGADPFAQDVYGITPIHQTLTCGDKRRSQVFLSGLDLLNVSVTGGITYLHIACIADNREAVRRLIELGADVNAAISFEPPMVNYSPQLVSLLTPYIGSTPLSLALENDCLSSVEILLSRGADLFARKPDGSTAIVQILSRMCTSYANVLLLQVRYNEAMLANLTSATGLTMLHIACNALDVSLVKYLLNDGAQVNARSHCDSPVWPGCTPLHVVLRNLNDRLVAHGTSRNHHVDNVHVVIRLLINYGADLTLTDTDKKTPTDISKELYRSYIRGKSWLCTMLPLGNHDYYDLNFVDKHGISPFQEACYQNNITVIKEFIKRGVDVNQKVDGLSDKYPGYTPLHFAARQRWKSLVGSSRQLLAIQLLLDHGADVHARDAYDNTPLHIAARKGFSREELISKLIEFGSNLNAINIYSDTPFEVLLKSSHVRTEEIVAFLQNGARINSYNYDSEMGYIPLLCALYAFDTIIPAIIDNTPDVTATDDKGRTIIHNIVSCTGGDPPNGLSSLCTRFIERGCDIDQQDELGRTALHMAVQWRNANAVLHLLIANANASIVDNLGKTAMDYALEGCNDEENCEHSEHEDVRNSFTLQVVKLQLTGFQELVKFKDHKVEIDREITHNLRKNLKKAKKTYIIPEELTVYDFASETGAVSSYLHMPIIKRNVVDEFFKSMADAHFGRASHWLKSHYRKAVARTVLIEPAKQSLNSLIDFSLPHLCSDAVFRFLSNLELKNLIAATSQDSNKI